MTIVNSGLSESQGGRFGWFPGRMNRNAHLLIDHMLASAAFCLLDSLLSNGRKVPDTKNLHRAI